jgi:hypothetical protein
MRHSLVNLVELNPLLLGRLPTPQEENHAHQCEDCGRYRDVKTDDPKLGDIGTWERHSILHYIREAGHLV